jgi:hypothetical protein
VCAGHLAVVMRSTELSSRQKLNLARSVLERYAVKDARLMLADVKQAGHIVLAGDWR